jgi:hypothetical protein
MAAVLLVFGTLILLAGVSTLVSDFKERGRRARIVATPTTAIADAPGNGPVAIQGRIVTGEQGLLVAPFSGRKAVWVNVVVSVRRMGGKRYSDILSETAGPPFLVDDGSGQIACVDPDGATMVLDVQKLAQTGTFKDAPPQLEQFLQARGKTSQGLVFNRDMLFLEQILIPGGTLTAIGRAHREAPTAQLVLRQSEGEAGELILTDLTREEFVAREKRGFGCACVVLGVGALLDVAGLVLLVVDKLT